MSDLYKKAGVDIDAGSQAVQLMKEAVRATYTPNVLSDVGNFGGLFSLADLSGMAHPVLVASMDGVGTKTKVAARANRWDTIGQDLVNHCINDILVQGARPLFFLDYVASDKLQPAQIAAIVNGMAAACSAAGCALLGGETAEMPGVYATGEVDVVGTIVGVVDKDSVIDGQRISAGDAIIAIPSSGLHTNGFTLARAVLEDFDWAAVQPNLGVPLEDALLAVHRCYLREVMALQRSVDVCGLAHITGGGVVDNLPRILPSGLGAQIRWDAWDVPALFKLIEEHGDVDALEMARVFNMGLGMLVIVPAGDAQTALDLVPDAFVVGEIIPGEGVQLV
ncbi:phosphoribosylformylglycinamidine cyclo-ligase [Phototrophicus methaneseepsis]|uniref:Phosphoribosylformylglycinamidine cyclo-ligase n=1 Tax=Phototrophicus methaneseepsis TaxID=2710758 RepID=A0A7S8IFA1_9CHLR|nr:phosphoribosylformylglycinamidine cyclo-ligase [Phototrophicus methaneseepsis]QPC83294.1 phosphoribosylformylglycinamidine cyclo-ligase [Phototrophicus methaneseepsis]